MANYTLGLAHAHFTDPESYFPERWLPTPLRPGNIITHNPAAVAPFGLGPRRCIGKELALVEMQLIIARLVWNFDLSMADPSKPLDWNKQKTYIFVQKEPVMVRLKIRN